MAASEGGVYSFVRVGLVLAISVGTKAAGVLIFTGVVAPLIGLGLKRLTGGWDNYGAGPFAILRDPPGRDAAPQPVDPAIQAAEVRQMLEAKAERRKVRGEAVLDVESESARLLAAAAASAPAAGHDEELRAEVRRLVVARNERRRRAGLETLDVLAETERQLADLGGAG